MKITPATVFYCGVMLFVSSFHIGTIFDPFLFLWAFCFFLGGPLLSIASIILLVRAIRQTLRPATLLPPLLCLATVGVWSFGFWRIGDTLRPVVFAGVARDNERLAVLFMQQHPPDTDAEVSGFRYPYFPIFYFGHTTVRHHAGVVSVWVPVGPGAIECLVYVSPGASLPNYTPIADSTGTGFTVEPLTKGWYYVHAAGI